MLGSRCFNKVVIRSFVILLICNNSCAILKTPRLLYIGHKQYGNTLPTFAAQFNKQTANQFLGQQKWFQQQFKTKMTDNNREKVFKSKPHAWIIENPVESALPRYINSMEQLKGILIQKINQQNQKQTVVYTMPTSQQRLRQITDLELIIKRILDANSGRVLTNGHSIHSLEPAVHSYVPDVPRNNKKPRLNASHTVVEFHNNINTPEDHKMSVNLSNAKSKPVEIYPKMTKLIRLGPFRPSVPRTMVRKKIRKIRKKRPTSTKEVETNPVKSSLSSAHLLAATNIPSNLVKKWIVEIKTTEILESKTTSVVTKTVENANTTTEVTPSGTVKKVTTVDEATLKILSTEGLNITNEERFHTQNSNQNSTPTEIQNEPKENLAKTILPAESKKKEDTPAESPIEKNFTTGNLLNVNLPTEGQVEERPSTENLNKMIPSTKIQSVNHSLINNTQLESRTVGGLPIQKVVEEKSSTLRALEDSSPTEITVKNDAPTQRLEESLPAKAAEENLPTEKPVQDHSSALRVGDSLPTEKAVQLNSATQKVEKSLQTEKAAEESLTSQKAAEASLNTEKTVQDNMPTQEVTENLRAVNETLSTLEAAPETSTVGTAVNDNSPDLSPLEKAGEENMTTLEPIPETTTAETAVNDNSSVTWGAAEVSPLDKALEESVHSEIPAEKTESPTTTSTIRTLGRPLVFASE